MSAARFDFVLDEGSDYRRRWTYESGGEVVDLTGWGAELIGRADPRAVGAPELRLTTATGLPTGVSATTGLVTDSDGLLFDLEEASTTGAWGLLRYDLHVFAPEPDAESPKRILWGLIYRSPKLARS